jgi:hypothetical protein
MRFIIVKSAGWAAVGYYSDFLILDMKLIYFLPSFHIKDEHNSTWTKYKKISFWKTTSDFTLTIYDFV